MPDDDPRSGASPAAALDPSVVHELRWLEAMSGKPLLADLIEAFVRDSSRALVALREALDARDGPATRRAAHRLKGSAAAIGAAEVRQIAAQLENGASSGAGLEGVALAARSLDAAIGRASEALREAAARPAPPALVRPRGLAGP